MSARRRKAVLSGRKYRKPKFFQFVRLWTDKNHHEETNNYRKVHGRPMLSIKGRNKRKIYIWNVLRSYDDFVKERGTDEC